METTTLPPNRDEIINMVAKHMYNGRIINNSHRGDIVEMMVLSALGDDWSFVELGWHPWDLQKDSGANRVRIQVKQCAVLQIWGKTQKIIVKFGWKKKAPDYFFRDNPGEIIEAEGWFCDVFVVGLHLESDKKIADQVNLDQWKFLVIPTSDLKQGQDSMVLAKALKRWQPISWTEIAKSVDSAIATNNKSPV